MTEPMALAGWRVLLARPEGRAGQLPAMLAAHGAHPQVVPLIGIESPVDPGPLDSAVRALGHGDYSWVALTSVNAVEAVWARAADLGVEPVVPTGTRTAVVGPATAGALADAGILPDLRPASGGSALELAQLFPVADPGGRVLLPQSAIASPVLADGLRDKGYRVDSVSAYRTVPLPVPSAVARDLAAGGFDAVLLTSPSTVAALTGVRILGRTVVGAIGPSTARAAAEAGLSVAFMADAPTDSSLLAGLRFAARSRATERNLS